MRRPTPQTIGLVLCGLIFLAGFALNGNFSLYFNLSGLLIVLAGTATATLLAFRLERLRHLSLVIRGIQTTRPKQEAEIVEVLIDLSIKSRVRGLLSLQEDENETTILFLRRALSCLVDGYEPQRIREILGTEMTFFKLRRDEHERVLRVIAEFFPTFGLIGSVVGLIATVGGIHDTTMVLRAIPVALTSTLYGLVLANFICLPLAASLRERTNHELLLQKIITEGVIAIEGELNPVILKTKLQSFLTPSERRAKPVSLARIRERFRIAERVGAPSAEAMEK
ncbi:MAG: flagellar motor protein MotA [Desulfobulbaceae bacterium A2]|nr:MAG: flagellar motor protein MotA [Desulfobulbaceae bacterium A2]